MSHNDEKMTLSLSSGASVSKPSHDECPDYEWYESWSKRIYLPEYYVITPIYVILGSLGRLALFWALRQNVRREKMYHFFVFVLISEIFEIFNYGIHVATFDWWSGATRPERKADWYTQCYSCMWYSAHLSGQLLNMNIFSTILLTICMSLDRLYALFRPLKYRSMSCKKKKNYQLSALILSVFIAGSLNIFDCFRFDIVRINVDDKLFYYHLTVNENFVDNCFVKVAAYLRCSIIFLGFFVLITSNIFIILLYRRRIQRSLWHASRTISDRTLVMSEKEKTLSVLTVFQSILSTFNATTLLTLYLAIYAVPEYSNCQALLWTPVIDAMIQLIDLIDFYMILLFSRRIRQMVWCSFNCTKRPTK